MRLFLVFLSLIYSFHLLAQIKLSSSKLLEYSNDPNCYDNIDEIYYSESECGKISFEYNECSPFISSYKRSYSHRGGAEELLYDILKGATRKLGCKRVFKILTKSGFDLDEILSVWKYTGGGYKKINEAFRKWYDDDGNTRPGIEARRLKVKKRYQPIIDSLVSALEKKTAYTGTVYRVLKMSRNNVKHFKVGEIVTLESFVSTSLNINTYAPSGNDQDTFIIESKTGTDISSISLYEKEKEILFQTGRKFLVNRIETVFPPTNMAMNIKEVKRYYFLEEL
ncbi:MAG: ADP-ribosyltransferase [Bacteriovoracaceae bacterium]